MIETTQSSKWCARCSLTIPPHRKHWCTTVVPSSQVGYGPGRFVARYYDDNVGVWFDIGDPHDTLTPARNAAAAFERTGTP